MPEEKKMVLKKWWSEVSFLSADRKTTAGYPNRSASSNMGVNRRDGDLRSKPQMVCGRRLRNP